MNKPVQPQQSRLVADLVDNRLLDFLEGENKKWVEVDNRMAEAVSYLQSVVESGGKRLRASFCYWSWYGAKVTEDPTYEPQDHPEDLSGIVDVCAALELLHTFALIHDDVMDDSNMRRGQTTVHRGQIQRFTEKAWTGESRRFGESIAVLVGNLGHVYSDILMANAPLEVRTIWNDLRVELNLGQYLDVRSAAASDLDFETAKQVAWYKSALYTIYHPMQLGFVMSSNTTPGISRSVARFSEPLGRAFQLRDDYLGIFGDAERLGKPIGDDLRDAKPTELMAYALQHADQDQRLILSKVGSADLVESDIAAISEVIRATGAVGYVEQEIESLIVSAERVLDEMPYATVAKQALSSLARYVASRNV